MTGPNISELVERVAGGIPTPHAVQFRFGDRSIRVEVNDLRLTEILGDYFREWLEPVGGDATCVKALELEASPLPVIFVDWVRDPGKVGQKDTCADIEGGRVVRKVRTGMQYLLGSGHRVIFGPCLEHPNQLVNFIVAQHINHLMRSGLALCHAAGVVHRGRGLAISGVSGAGKSTLALHLMVRGARFTSNDRLFVGPRGGEPLMAGVPKQPRINPGTALSIDALREVLPEHRRRQLGMLDRDALWELEEKYDVDIERTFGAGRWQLEAPARAFLVLTWHRASLEATRIRRVALQERPDLLEAIMKPPGPFYEDPEHDAPRGIYRMSPETYLANLEGIPVYEASGRVDFDHAADICLDEILGS
jgi:HprK-related kinase B